MTFSMEQMINWIIGFDGIFGTDNQFINAIIGMTAVLTYLGIRRGIRAYRGWGAHKWACPSCRFKVETSDALFCDRVKADHLHRFHDIREEKGA